MDIIYHYPPELLSLLIDAIPLLCRSKKNLILFFKGAGVNAGLMNDLIKQVNNDPDNITKFEITRAILTRLNEKGEATLGERREILKRVSEFEDFSTCWPEDQLKVKGLVAEIRRVINVKDSFTRMRQEKEEERKKHQAQQQEIIEKVVKKKNKMEAAKRELYPLFSEKNPQKRGKMLERALNSLFQASEILVREAFTLRSPEGAGILEQIDGVVEINGHLYLVEMKWWDKPIGKAEVSPHLVRIFGRSEARGIFISNSNYTGPAIAICKEALQKSVVVLCGLDEIVSLLENEKDLVPYLNEKINAAIIDKNPLHFPMIKSLS